MLNISRWTTQGGSYRTMQRFFNTVMPWPTMCWLFFRTHLLDRESDYILARDEGVVPKAGKSTYGLSRFFASLSGKAVPGVAFLAVSL
jgi:putative transposase